MSTVQILNGPIIRAGESLSEPIDCSAGRIIRLTTPAEWDKADLSFEISTDGAFFNPLYRANGEQYAVECDKARAIIINQEEWIPGLHVKIRSGTYGVHVSQSADREFAIALLVDDAPALESADDHTAMLAKLAEIEASRVSAIDQITMSNYSPAITILNTQGTDIAELQSMLEA